MTSKSTTKGKPENVPEIKTGPSAPRVNEVRMFESAPNEAYLDRNIAVQAFARLAQRLGMHVGMSDDPHWPILYVETAEGQVSWHIPRKEVIGQWPPWHEEWDGHDLHDKRLRLALLARGSHDEE